MAKSEKPQNELSVQARLREQVNPANAEIMSLRKEGQDVPQELLEKKFAYNRALFNKDLRR